MYVEIDKAPAGQQAGGACWVPLPDVRHGASREARVPKAFMSNVHNMTQAFGQPPAGCTGCTPAGLAKCSDRQLVDVLATCLYPPFAGGGFARQLRGPA